MKNDVVLVAIANRDLKKGKQIKMIKRNAVTIDYGVRYKTPEAMRYYQLLQYLNRYLYPNISIHIFEILIIIHYNYMNTLIIF